MEFPNHLKILLVEDNMINQRLASFIFKQLQVGCDLASNGEEAAQLYMENRYDLVLMDLHMPILDGFEASKAIRKIENEASDDHRAKIIALSASEPYEIIGKCKECGMDDFLEKPLQENKLRDLVTRYF